MSAEEKIENCIFNLNQIKHFEPDPHYTMYFFKKFIQNVIQFYDAILEEANRDFGLFSENCMLKKIEKKANEKNDKKAIDFLNWVKKEFEKEFENPFPKFVREIINMKLQKRKFPPVKIMLRPKERYKNDLYQEINVKLKDGKIKSKEELNIEVKRVLPIFLEIINNKRKISNEPTVNEDQIVISAFMNTSNSSYIEIAYALEIYIPIMKRFMTESRNKIKNLTKWNDG